MPFWVILDNLSNIAGNLRLLPFDIYLICISALMFLSLRVIYFIYIIRRLPDELLEVSLRLFELLQSTNASFTLNCPLFDAQSSWFLKLILLGDDSLLAATLSIMLINVWGFLASLLTWLHWLSVEVLSLSLYAEVRAKTRFFYSWRHRPYIDKSSVDIVPFVLFGRNVRSKHF